jgi:hypothetical protein
MHEQNEISLLYTFQSRLTFLEVFFKEGGVENCRLPASIGNSDSA